MSKPEKLAITQWAEEDRPREKLVEKGPLALTNAELLAILLGSGNNEENAVDLAKRILQQYDHSLTKLLKTSINELKKFKGVGTAKAVTIMASLELSRRILAAKESTQNIRITSPEDAYKAIAPHLYDLPHEEFWILLLSTSNQVIEKHKIAQGGINATHVDVRLILQKSLLANAVGIILCHNHPSGNLTPSQNDKTLTKSLKDACQLLQIQLHDHIIVAGETYLSFADQGLL
ncbi:MAG TPA: DNA repair protein RadC [Salinivirgaceae bacterium]|nr:DNA repair protein RadC [Salinivirgaceae bacterium]